MDEDAAVFTLVELLTLRALVSRRDAAVFALVKSLTLRALVACHDTAMLALVELLALRTAVLRPRRDAAVFALVELLTRRAMACRFYVDATAFEQNEYLAGWANRLRRRRLHRQRRPSRAKAKADEKPKRGYFSSHNSPPLDPVLVIDRPGIG
jgi:hypothetical protein